MAIPHKAHLTALHVICLHIFRHLTQKFLDIRPKEVPLGYVSMPAKFLCNLTWSPLAGDVSAKLTEGLTDRLKSDCASAAQSLCGVAIAFILKVLLPETETVFLFRR